MTAVCAGVFPKTLSERLAASENRLDATLAGVRRLKPAAEKFYATLNDAQKTDVGIPGL
jgi:hypothetical protein